jgi:hypothetical protein
MPPRYLRKGTTKLKPCSEFKVEACDIAPADQCCGALPCTLCLELEVYGEPTTYGTATFGGSSWTGTVGGLAFVSYWERDAYGECEYIVTLDGEEVYRATCYEGASCRDPGGSVGVLIGYDEGTLTWTKHEPRPLAVTTDPDTGCNDFFCGTCRCSCDCLCVTITEPDGTVMLGEICSTSYPCDAPVWEGSIGYYDLSAALGRDDYTGECTISLTASGEDADPVFASGCGNMSASVTLYDGTVISVRCKQCSCEETDTTTCCDGRPCAGSGEPNAMPSTLTVEVSATYNTPPVVSPPGSGFEPPANSTCFNFSFTIGGGCVQGQKTYGGVGEHSCTWCGRTYNIRLSIVLACGANGWLLTIEDVVPPGDCNRDVSGDQFRAFLAGEACDPVLISGDLLPPLDCLDCNWMCQIGSIETSPGVLVPVLAYHSPFCLSFLVYETP